MLAPRELAARGFSPTSQRILTPAGDVLPRRQVMNELLAGAGYAGKEGTQRGAWRTWQQERLSPQYQRDIGEALQKAGAMPGAGQYGREYRELRAYGSEFNELARAASRAKGRAERDPAGPVAEFLEFIGRREPGAPYDVGDTPFKRKKRGRPTKRRPPRTPAPAPLRKARPRPAAGAKTTRPKARKR